MTNLFTKKNLFIALTSLISTACSTYMPNTSSPAKNAIPSQSLTSNLEKNKSAINQQSSDQLTHWHITGAIAAKRNKKAWSASLSWKQFNSNDYRIHLFGPLGGGNVVLEKKGKLFTYQDGGKIKKSTNEQSLLHQETGMHLPISQLYFWIRGLKAPGEITQAQYDAAGHLITFHQAGYTLQYANYRTFNQYELPTKIRIDNQEGFVKLAIKQWN